MHELPSMVTAAEAAEILDVHHVTVHRWGRSGRLTVAVKTATTTLFFEDEVREMARALATVRTGVTPAASA